MRTQDYRGESQVEKLLNLFSTLLLRLWRPGRYVNYNYWGAQQCYIRDSYNIQNEVYCVSVLTVLYVRLSTPVYCINTIVNIRVVLSNMLSEASSLNGRLINLNIQFKPPSGYNISYCVPV